MYIYENKDWPNLHWDDKPIADRLACVRHHQGRLQGRMEALGFPLRGEAVLQTLTEDVLKSSEIEGEILDKAQVRSSVARRLGMDIAGLTISDHHVDGIVEMMLDATQNYNRPLDAKRLFVWHAALFPTGKSGMRKITVGGWRTDKDGPMQVVSGPVGREHVHFQAPPAKHLQKEMIEFLRWYNGRADHDLVLKSAMAHLWFITIHPFDDGNGRIARAISDQSLALSEQSPERFYSMSSQIRHEREDYYDILENTQKGGLDISEWLLWYLGCLDRAIDGAEIILGKTLRKARFWEAHRHRPFNDRQGKILNHLLDGFEGKLTSSKWAKINKCSQDTALRDINDLLQQGILVKEQGGGRSTSYVLIP